MATFSPAVEEFFFEAPVRLREDLFLTVTMKTLLTLLQALGTGEGKDAVLWRKTYADMRWSTPLPFVVRNAFSKRNKENWERLVPGLFPLLKDWAERPLRSQRNKKLQRAYKRLRPAVNTSGDILYETSGSIKPATFFRDVVDAVASFEISADILGRENTNSLAEYVEDYVVKKGRRPLTKDTLAAVDAYIADGLLLGDDE